MLQWQQKARQRNRDLRLYIFSQTLNGRKNPKMESRQKRENVQNQNKS